MAALKRRLKPLAGEILARAGQANELESSDLSCQIKSDFDGLDRAHGARTSPPSSGGSSISLRSDTMADCDSRNQPEVALNNWRLCIQLPLRTSFRLSLDGAQERPEEQASIDLAGALISSLPRSVATRLKCHAPAPSRSEDHFGSTKTSLHSVSPIFSMACDLTGSFAPAFPGLALQSLDVPSARCARMAAQSDKT